MKRQIKFLVGSLFMISALLLVSSCKDDDDEKLDAPRLFKPQISVDNSVDNQFIVNWLSIKGAVEYIVEVSRDEFETIDQTLSAESDENSLIVGNLLAAQDYQVRIKAMHPDPALSSKYFTVEATTATIFINPNPASEIIDIGFKVKWEPRGNAVTKIQILNAEGTEIIKEVELSEEAAAKAIYTISGLDHSTTFTVHLFSGDILRGKGQITTRIGIEGDHIIDLRPLEFYANLLFDTISVVPSGSLVLLGRGLQYELPSTPYLSGSVTLMSGYDYSEELAIVAYNSWLSIESGAVIDSIVFRDIKMQSLPGRFSGSYALGLDRPGTVDKIIFENCHIRSFRGLIRVRLASGGTTTVENLYINNCVIDSIGNYAIIHTENFLNTLRHTHITNTTFYDVYRGFYGRNNFETLTIENCTFNRTPAHGHYLVNFEQGHTGSVVMRNNIFGAIKPNTLGETVGHGVRAPNISFLAENTWYTNDFTLSEGYPIPEDFLPYSKASTEIYRDPLSGDFTIIDNSFPGRNTAGAFRWRP